MYPTLCVLALALLIRHAQADAESFYNVTATESCALLYEKGVEAYLENRFADCVTHLEAALEKYNTYTKKVQNCRLTCKEEAEQSDPIYPVDIENLRFYEKAIKNTLCLIKCQNKSDLFNMHLNAETNELFQNRKPYEYLHICYFQVRNRTEFRGILKCV